MVHATLLYSVWFAHASGNMEACDTNMDKTRGSKKANKLPVKPPSPDSSPEEFICQSLSGLSLEERERQVVAEIATIKLENRTAELESEHERMLPSRHRRPTIINLRSRAGRRTVRKGEARRRQL